MGLGSKIPPYYMHMFFNVIALQILFALSSGEKLALWSPDERRSLGKDLLKKLNLLRVCMQRQDALWIGQFER